MNELAATTPLTIAEQDALAHYEEVVRQGLETFYEVGSALAAIRDGKLYRVGYGTFEDYCRQRWGIARRTAYQLVDAAEVYGNVRNCAQTLPANEAQARPLVMLRDPEQQREAWRESVETAPEGRVTAAHVARVVENYRPAPSPLSAAVAESLEADASFRDDALMEQYHALMQRLLGACSAGRDLIRHVEADDLARLITEDDMKSWRYVDDLLDWFGRVKVARGAIVNIRRVK